MVRANSVLLAHDVVARPFSARIEANAVPHEPAPTTAIRDSSITEATSTSRAVPVPGGPSCPSSGIAIAKIGHHRGQLVHDHVGGGPERGGVVAAREGIGDVDWHSGLQPDRAPERQTAG